METWTEIHTDTCIRYVDVDRDIYVGQEKIEVDESESNQTRQSFGNENSSCKTIILLLNPPC